MNKKEENSLQMPFMEHLKELRKRIIYSSIILLIFTIICSIFYKEIFEFLWQPFYRIAGKEGDKNIIVLDFLEGFLTILKLSFYVGFFLSFPFHLYHLLRFIFPGLKKTEKTIISYTLITSFFLFIIGFYFAYVYMIPYSLDFLTSSKLIPNNIKIQLKLSTNTMITLNFLAAAVVLFQSPIVLFILMKMQLVSRKKLLNSSRYAIIIIFILSAILTPPDIISQVLLSLPLIILYFMTLFIAYILKIG